MKHHHVYSPMFYHVFIGSTAEIPWQCPHFCNGQVAFFASSFLGPQPEGHQRQQAFCRRAAEVGPAVVQCCCRGTVRGVCFCCYEK
jgi:hypothetical protein